MKAVVAVFNQEKALVGAFSVIVHLRRLIVCSTTTTFTQGELGDCWLLAAMANLTMDKRVRARVVPLDQVVLSQNSASRVE